MSKFFFLSCSFFFKEKTPKIVEKLMVEKEEKKRQLISFWLGFLAIAIGGLGFCYQHVHSIILQNLSIQLPYQIQLFFE